jgi:hypothetical protein
VGHTPTDVDTYNVLFSLSSLLLTCEVTLKNLNLTSNLGPSQQLELVWFRKCNQLYIAKPVLPGD